MADNKPSLRRSIILMLLALLTGLFVHSRSSPNDPVWCAVSQAPAQIHPSPYNSITPNTPFDAGLESFTTSRALPTPTSQSSYQRSAEILSPVASLPDQNLTINFAIRPNFCTLRPVNARSYMKTVPHATSNPVVRLLHQDAWNLHVRARLHPTEHSNDRKSIHAGRRRTRTGQRHSMDRLLA